MGTLIVPEIEFLHIESYLAAVIDSLVPEELRNKFEFHASAMFNGNPPFEKLPHDDAIQIIESCLTIIENGPISFIYAGVDTALLKSGIFATAEPVDVSFRRCIHGVAGWFHENPTAQIGMFICDNPSNKGVKEDLQRAFRTYRRNL